VANDGNHITIVSTGGALRLAKETAYLLSDDGIQARVIHLHTLKPIDQEIILKAAKETAAVFTIEEHCVIGGLGSAVAEILAEANLKTTFKRLALPDSFIKETGSRNYLLEKTGLSAKTITQTILKLVQR
jgi:transketolase